MRVAVDVRVRALREGDADAIAAIDARHRGRRHDAFWRDVVRRHVRPAPGSHRVGLVAEDARSGAVVGYVLAQVRALEFGSKRCGWVYAVGVRPERAREGIASRLLEEVAGRLAAEGVGVVRTLVRRDDVPTLTFFRSNAFVGGPYVELERRLTGAADARDGGAPEEAER